MNGVTNGVFHTTPILPTTPIILHRLSKPLHVPASSPHSGLVQPAHSIQQPLASEFFT